MSGKWPSRVYRTNLECKVEGGSSWQNRTYDHGNEGAVHNNTEDVQEMDFGVTSCRDTAVVIVATELVGDDDGLVVWSRFMSVYPAW